MNANHLPDVLQPGLDVADQHDDAVRRRHRHGASILDQMQSGSINVQVNDDTAAGLGDLHGRRRNADGRCRPVQPYSWTVEACGSIRPLRQSRRSINGGVAASSLTIAPGGSLSASTTTTSRPPTRTLKIEIAGPAAGQFGKVTVGDKAMLGGTLAIEFVERLRADDGHGFRDSHRRAACMGTKFASTMLPTLGGTLAWELIYDADSVIAACRRSGQEISIATVPSMPAITSCSEIRLALRCHRSATVPTAIATAWSTNWTLTSGDPTSADRHQAGSGTDANSAAVPEPALPLGLWGVLAAHRSYFVAAAHLEECITETELNLAELRR